jgi:ketosteroid isomerase-like protein
MLAACPHHFGGLMKRWIECCLAVAAVFAVSVSVSAQDPPAGETPAGARGGRGAGTTGAPAADRPFLQISTDPGPAAEMVHAALDAFNRRDLAYFRKALAEDAVWLDDDGHVFASRNQIVAIPLTAELTEATKRKLTPSNMRSWISGDTAWATFYYELDTDGVLRHGLSTMVFRKVGSDWLIAAVQAASNTKQTHLMGDHTEQ